ncbi:hypothetical protein [Streptomyces gilvosporeus]|nr:hypothetical protein [Streptomyces gilvosporeus]
MELLRNASSSIADIAQMVYLRLGLARSTEAPALPVTDSPTAAP